MEKFWQGFEKQAENNISRIGYLGAIDREVRNAKRGKSRTGAIAGSTALAAGAGHSALKAFSKKHPVGGKPLLTAALAGGGAALLSHMRNRNIQHSRDILRNTPAEDQHKFFAKKSEKPFNKLRGALILDHMQQKAQQNS